jgi:hypothetical protein
VAADTDGSPDNYEVLDFGVVSDGSVTSAKLSTSSVTGHTEDTSPDVNSDYILVYDTSGTALKKTLLRNAQVGSITSKFADYTVTPADRTIYVDPGSTTTITLYASSGATAGNIHTIKRYGTVSTYALTIAPDGSETIDVDTSIDLSMFGDSITIINTGSGWRILEYYMAPIVCQATLSTGTHTLNDNFQAVPFSSEDFDPAAAINAGTFTAPAAG